MLREFLGVFANAIDYSEQAKDYLVNNFTINFNGSDYLYVGYRKKFTDIYIQRIEAQSQVGNEKWEFYDGSTWNILPCSDESQSLKKSGFVLFYAPSNWKEFSLVVGAETKKLFFLRIKKDAAVAIEFTGINTIFANDEDLKEEYRKIEEFKEAGDATFIANHQAVKKDIVQNIRNKRNAKFSNQTDMIADITEWDLLDRSQVRRCATYWALSKIFFNVSDKTDGKFYQLAMDYKKKGEAALETYLLFLDTADKGEQIPDEESSTTTTISYMV